MVTRENIADFYRRYKVNMKREQQIQETVLKSVDQEGWVENLRRKSKAIRGLYVENEAMLNLYIRPFLREEVHLNEELAAEFLSQLLQYRGEGLLDEVVCVDVAHLLERYYKQAHDRDGWIMATNLLGGYYNNYNEPEMMERSQAYFASILEYRKDYENIEEWDVRRCVLLAFYNYPAVMMNGWKFFAQRDAAYMNRVIKAADQALAFFDEPAIRQMDGERYELDELKKELLYDVYGNGIDDMDSCWQVNEPFARRVREVMAELYAKALAENDNMFDMEPQIYCGYWKCQYLCGKVSCQEFVEKYMEFCRHVMKTEALDREEDFTEGRRYQVGMFDIPALLAFLDDLEEGQREKIIKSCIRMFLDFVEELPRYPHAVFVNSSIVESLELIMRYMPSEQLDFHFLLHVLINRDETIMIHAAMVQQLALAWLHWLRRNRPELLVGLLGTKNVLDVLKQQEKLEHFVSEAALIFDIGKIGCADVVSKQSRRLNQREQAYLRSHTQMGYEMAKKVECLAPYLDIIRFHHKAYDGKSGYPINEDYGDSPVALFIDLIKICDCTDAATDTLGRTYNHPKTPEEFFEELQLGAGQQYHPKLVQFLMETPGLQEELSYLCTAGRNRIYYETYQQFLEKNSQWMKGTEQEDLFGGERFDNHSVLLENVQEDAGQRNQVLQSLAKASMFIGYINLYRDDMRVFYDSHSSWLPGVKEGSFRNFVRKYLKARMPAEDWHKVDVLLNYGTLNEKLYASDGTFELEVRLKKKLRERWVRMQFIMAREDDGVPRRLTLVITDIDEAKLRRDQMNMALEIANAQARQASVAKSNFLSNMSHDIRTPMNAIIGMTQIAKRNLDDRDKVQVCLDKIQGASEHLLQLVNEILDISKNESGKLELDEKKISMKNLIANTMAVTQELVDKKGIERNLYLEEMTQEWAYGDEVRIQQILMNLMSNAIKYTPEGGRICFTAKNFPDRRRDYMVYQFVLEDNGVGMSPEFLNKVFEPFEQDSSHYTGTVEGTGLGFSITRSLAEMMQGNFTVQSREGEGSRFEVTLRLRCPEEAREEEEAALQEGAREEEEAALQEGAREEEEAALQEGAYRGCHLLLTEDNEINREIVMELLEETGILIDQAQDGKAAVEMVQSREPGYYDLIFMDVQMPVMDGYEATRAIRAYEQDKGVHTPILALTANSFAEDYSRALEAGMDGHMGKPVELPKVLAAMNKWMKGVSF